MLYLDTSSLVKLYVAEAGSDTVRTLVHKATAVATAGVAYPEARAALARRRRERTLLPAAFRSAKKTLEADWSRYIVVEVTALLCREACDLAERHRLRGYDSIHLAAFLKTARLAGVRNTRFSSFDESLNRAARSLLRTLLRAN
jgi:predicted nucleic acid-binding protein